MKKSYENLSFEQALEKMEQVLEKMELGELQLEEAVKLYQEGMELSMLCSKKLENVEKKIETLIEKNGVVKLEEIELEEE